MQNPYHIPLPILLLPPPVCFEPSSPNTPISLAYLLYNNILIPFSRARRMLFIYPFFSLFFSRSVIILAFRMISNPSDITPTFAVDTVADLQDILKDKHYNEQGTAAIVISTADVYMLDGSRQWVKL